MSELDHAEYTLYSSPFSLYSMMVRHTIYLGTATSGAKPPQKITLHHIGRRQPGIPDGNLDEDYLVNVNPKGQVPALAGNVLEKPLSESLNISLYFVENHYPALVPASHATIIRDLLSRIHAIYGLSFSQKNPTAEMMQYNPSPAEEILKRGDLSPQYRKALEVKLAFHDKNNAIAFHPNVVAEARANLQTIFAEIVEHRKQAGASDGDWTFGSQVGPTLLDAHLLPVVLRCVDANNAELVPEELQRWGAIQSTGDMWLKVMHGRPTHWNPSLGPVTEMKDLMSL